MRIYDEENLDFDDDEFDGEMAGYSLDEENSIFGQLAPEKDGETLATPIPQNEQTVCCASRKLRDSKTARRLICVLPETTAAKCMRATKRRDISKPPT